MNGFWLNLYFILVCWCGSLLLGIVFDKIFFVMMFALRGYPLIPILSNDHFYFFWSVLSHVLLSESMGQFVFNLRFFYMIFWFMFSSFLQNFCQLQEIFLSMRSDLGTGSSFHQLLNGFPIFSMLDNGFIHFKIYHSKNDHAHLEAIDLQGSSFPHTQIQITSSEKP